MMIRVNGELLDYNGDIELVRQAKLFEQIDGTLGDFSYSFEIPITAKNLSILTFPLPDVSSKKIYQKVECDILDDEGFSLYKGSLRIEKVNTIIKCSFFSGNTNWIANLTGLISALDFSELDTTINISNIQASWDLTEGIKFPFMDAGNLLTRSHGSTVIEDWSPCIFVKTIFQKIFQSQSIKIRGELINDELYDALLVSTNTKDSSEIENNSCLIGKTLFQGLGTTPVVVSWQDDSTYPFHNTLNNDFDIANNKFTSPIFSRYKIEISLTTAWSIDRPRLIIRKNGVDVHDYQMQQNYSVTIYITLQIGDYIDFTAKTTSLAAVGIILYPPQGTIKITPFFNYDVKGKSVVPKWTQQNFVKAVLSLFNVVSDYDPYSKTITFNYFDKVSQKTSTDISKYVSVTETDFVEFVSNYGKNNYFGYKQTDSNDLKKYNVKNFLNYGKGNIPIDNYYLQLSSDVVKSDFSSPVSYINRQFGSPSLERLNLLQLNDSDSVDLTSISDDSGISKFNVSSDIIQAGDLVRIETDSKNLAIEGEWVVGSIGSGFFEIAGLTYSNNETGKVTILITGTASNDDVFLLVDARKWSYLDMSTFQYLYIYDTLQFAFTETNACFFNMLDIKKPISRAFNQGLSFGSITNILSFQKNLLETFWSSFRIIMNDPTKIFLEGYLPKKIYLDLSPLTPVFIKTEKSSNKYYVNKITGYKNSYTPCIIELIKL